MKYLPIIVLLTATYVTLTSNLQPINILFGLLIAVGVTALLRPPMRPRNARQSAIMLFASLRYIRVLMVDLAVSGVQTARLVLSPSLPLNPGVLRIPSNTETDMGAALSAHAITLTPGELVVEMDSDNDMYTHVLEAEKAADHVTEAQELRRSLLNQIFP